MWKEIFHQFCQLFSLAKLFIPQFFLSCVGDCTGAWDNLGKKKKKYCTEYFCNKKGIAGLGKIFVQRKFLTVQYMQLHMYVLVLEIIGEW